MKYIPPNKGKMYWFIASLRAPYRYGVTFFVIAIVGYLWFIALYRPIQSFVQLQHVKVNELQKKEALYTQSRKHDSQLSEMVHDMQRTMLQHSQGAQEISADSGMVVLVEAADASGLRFISCAWENQHQTSWAVGDRFRCMFEGTLDQAKSFFARLKSGRYLVGCYALALTRVRDSVFTISCTLDVYALKPDCLA